MAIKTLRFCIYCKQVCGNCDEVVRTRRKTYLYFHKKCYLNELEERKKHERTDI